MSEKTAIGWTSHTFNAWWGCVRVSDGCTNCYAETFSKRTGHDIWGPAKTTPRRFFGDKHWAEPLAWNRAAEAEGRRHRVFTASMSDVFEDHPDVGPHRDRLFSLIEATPWLDWQVLTKRPENVLAMIPERWRTDPPLNWWQGTSVEDQRAADVRIPHLLATPAAVRFLSVEPLLGPVRLPLIQLFGRVHPTGNFRTSPEGRRQLQFKTSAAEALLHWVIVGGESGPGHRTMDLAWLEDIAVICQQAGISTFVKQDSGQYPGKQGRIPDDLWGLKQFPETRSAVLVP